MKYEKTEFRIQNPVFRMGRRSQNIGKLWKWTPNKDAMKMGIKELKVGTGGQCRVGRWSKLGKGGRVTQKLTGFSHLFRHESMQVVDFQLLSRLMVFWESEDSPQRRRDAETSAAWNRHGGAGNGVEEYWSHGEANPQVGAHPRDDGFWWRLARRTVHLNSLKSA